jgi:hypothetical protein
VLVHPTGSTVFPAPAAYEQRRTDDLAGKHMSRAALVASAEPDGSDAGLICLPERC